MPSALSLGPDFSNRLRAVREGFLATGADAFLITHLPNVFYLSGFSGSAGALLIDSAGVTLFTDGRYRFQAREEVGVARVRILGGPLLEAVGEFLRRRCRRVAFDPGRLSVAQKQQLARAAGPRVRWVVWDGGVENLRSVKEPGEIAQMREAAHLASEVFEQIVKLVEPGVRELDLAAEVDFRMRRKGARGPAFETIVAAGPRSAWPHARPTAKPLSKNELVVFDLGAILRGYCSDLTRTVYVGRAPARIRRWYRAVLEAQSAAREALSPGAAAGAVDAAARKVLRGYGLEKQFIHSSGHGLGLEVHESPRLGRGEKFRLKSGNVVTLEPGIYVEGIGGIRIEDDVVIHPGGTEILTLATRELLEL